MNTKRIGYWPLRTDGADASPYGRHAVPHAVAFREGAELDGIASSIRLPDTAETDGSRPFSFAVEFEVNDSGGYVPGGLCSRYEEATMQGWHLSVLTQAGVTSTQSNLRNLQFGWSTGQAADEWTDWGSPGDCRLVFALCVFEGHLYAGTFDDARDHKGRVYRLGEDGAWVDCGNPDDSNAVASLAEFNGKLYAGTMRYKAAGSLLPESPNREPGGRVYRYDGGQQWTLLGELPVPGNDSVGSLTAYQGRLIAMSYYPFGVFAFAEDGSCEPLGAPGPDLRTLTVAPYRGELYIGCNQSGGIYKRTLSRPWEFCGTAPRVVQVYCFSVYHNELLTGIWDEGRMLRYEGGATWSDFGLMGAEQEVMGVSVYNGRLYAGTLPGGHVYRYAGDRTWEFVKELEPPAPGITYRRVWSMAVYQGNLFAGTLPGGRVWSLTNDPLATCDSSLRPGWHRAAVTYDTRKLDLYLDGRFVSSAPFRHEGGPPLTRAPLLLGKGPQCHFSGRLREAELYDGVLTAEEIGRLGQEGGEEARGS